EGDEAEAELEAALSAFEERVGGDWDDDGADGDVLADMDQDAQERLRDLGYLE
ncbi:MAG: sulfatase, partial [Actinobacteria bacterium]|nr:sulfatase [Actinomycetota bacterium]